MAETRRNLHTHTHTHTHTGKFCRAKTNRFGLFLISFFILFCSVVRADTETIEWYKDGDVYATTTCETGGDVELPETPEKRGYDFNGWEFLYDFSTLDYTIPGDNYRYNSTTGMWEVWFSYGTLFGIGLCSSTPGESGDIGTPDETSVGQYCWCKLLQYQSNDTGVVYKPVVATSWVFSQDYGSASVCPRCRDDCGATFRNRALVRRVAFGITQ